MIAPLFLLVVLAILVVIVSVIHWIAKYFRDMAAERRRLRLEVGKLAHELEALRNDRGPHAEAAMETER